MTESSTALQLSTDEDLILPWWYSKLNVAVVVLAAAILAGAIGWFVGSRDDAPGPGSVDVGFLQDMRIHHEQAVQIATIYLESADGVNPYLKEDARGVQFGQALEIGRMVQLLRDFGAPETNETETVMAWMDAPVSVDRMPGLASDADLERLAASEGEAADQLFASLMIAHHLGGIHMAQYAADNAANAEVRAIANAIVRNQNAEINELRALVSTS